MARKFTRRNKCLKLTVIVSFIGVIAVDVTMLYATNCVIDEQERRHDHSQLHKFSRKYYFSEQSIFEKVSKFNDVIIEYVKNESSTSGERSCDDIQVNMNRSSNILHGYTTNVWSLHLQAAQHRSSVYTGTKQRTNNTTLSGRRGVDSSGSTASSKQWYKSALTNIAVYDPTRSLGDGSVTVLAI